MSEQQIEPLPGPDRALALTRAIISLSTEAASEVRRLTDLDLYGKATARHRTWQHDVYALIKGYAPELERICEEYLKLAMDAVAVRPSAPIMVRQTHTYVTLDISEAAYTEIRGKLEAAGYQHTFISGGEIDMQGIAVKNEG